MLFALMALVALLAGAGAAPQRPQQAQQAAKDIPIIKQDFTINEDGSYQWNYETGNGIAANEQGSVKNAGNPETEAISVQGQFSYTADDGTPIQLQYLADENGFQPQGAHLPTPPPIPEAIQRALEWNAAHPEQDNEGEAPAAPARPAARGRK
ncbi:Cuticle Protein CPR RR-1 5 [Frankliniella occidentalis]|uniref:Endocuticle structural glycoprotein ABD-4-like n=1 Tax=Frankliniella occidentalis TaxID=133901 RepID=A0A6J1SC72_FRAOC|nr:endocuticle structural glycoprotein ABD-4-like [Frankliniella occidentalis]KAE8744064.1 Cuticle Protein CPR RR-1 5 [Frankliniella occidentalis]